MQIHSYKVNFRLAYILYAFSSCLYFGLFIPRLAYTSTGLCFNWFILWLVSIYFGLFIPRLLQLVYTLASIYFSLFIPRLVYTSADLYFNWYILWLVYTSAGLFTLDNCCAFSLPDGLKTGKWYDVGVEKTKDNMKLTVGGDSLTLKTMVCRKYFFLDFIILFSFFFHYLKKKI